MRRGGQASAAACFPNAHGTSTGRKTRKEARYVRLSASGRVHLRPTTIQTEVATRKRTHTGLSLTTKARAMMLAAASAVALVLTCPSEVMWKAAAVTSSKAQNNGVSNIYGAGSTFPSSNL